MGDIEFIDDYRARRSENILADIVFVLKRMGGAGHLNVISAAVQAKIRQDHGDQSKIVTKDVEYALSIHELDQTNPLNSPLFWRPFGANSNRWALHQPVAVPSFSSLQHRIAE